MHRNTFTYIIQKHFSYFTQSQLHLEPFKSQQAGRRKKILKLDES